MDEIAMLKLGNFKYGIGLLPLRFEGPDKEDIDFSWGEAPINGSEVDVGFYDIVDTALNGTGLNLKFPQNEVGLRMITYFTGAVVLHEIMHNHGFRHPKAVDWNPGSVYASTLPHVALLAVLRASPEWSVFQPAIGAGFPTGGYPVLRHENSAAFTDDKSIWLEVVLQMRSIVLRGIHWRFLSCEQVSCRRRACSTAYWRVLIDSQRTV